MTHEEVRKKVAAHDATLGQMNARLGHMEARVTAIEARLSGVERRILYVGGALAVLMSLDTFL